MVTFFGLFFAKVGFRLGKAGEVKCLQGKGTNAQLRNRTH